MVRSLLILLILGTVPVALAAQAEPPPTVTIAGTTPKAVGEALKRALADQKFKVSVTNRRIVLTQDRGRLPQSTGEALRIRMEIGLQVHPTPTGLTLTLADETLFAERGGMLEQRRAMDPERNRVSYQTLLNRVKAELEAGGVGHDTTASRDTVPRAAP